MTQAQGFIRIKRHSIPSRMPSEIRDCWINLVLPGFWRGPTNAYDTSTGQFVGNYFGYHVSPEQVMSIAKAQRPKLWEWLVKNGKWARDNNLPFVFWEPDCEVIPD